MPIHSACDPQTREAKERGVCMMAQESMKNLMFEDPNAQSCFMTRIPRQPNMWQQVAKQ